MKDGLTLNPKDERRIGVLNRVLEGLLTVAESAPLLGVSERQARRLLVAYRKEGARSLVHGNRGRSPSHSTPEDIRLKVLALATGQYAGLNHSHLTEILAEREGISLSRPTVVRILGDAGIRSPKPQARRPKHRSRRERKPQVGMLLQVDASHHAWFQERGPRVALLAVIDDAGSRVEAARFRESEDAHGYFLLLRDLCLKVGVPQALYTEHIITEREDANCPCSVTSTTSSSPIFFQFFPLKHCTARLRVSSWKHHNRWFQKACTTSQR